MSELERSAWGLVEAADEEVASVTVETLRGELDESNEREGERESEGEADEQAAKNRGETIAIDIRDIREVWIEGSIPGAEHAPRGMIEFWADPETEYYRDFFEPGNRYVLYCNEAGRSALAAKRLAEMGYEDVAHLEGGFTAWQAAGGEVIDVPQKDYKDR
jgi:rhodanese-related sulfurtransferase